MSKWKILEGLRPLEVAASVQILNEDSEWMHSFNSIVTAVIANKGKKELRGDFSLQNTGKNNDKNINKLK